MNAADFNGMVYNPFFNAAFHRVALKWLTSCVIEALRIEKRTVETATIGRVCTPSGQGEPRCWAAIRINATTAAIWRYPITPAGTGMARNAKPTVIN